MTTRQHSGPPAGAAEPGPADPLKTVFAAIRSGDLATAKRLARAALAAGHEHPHLLNLRAMELEEAGRLGEALADLRRAHILSPRDYAILNATGLCLARMERHEEALRCYDQALAIEPDFGPAWFNRGAMLERLGDVAGATASYLRAVEIQPENPHGWANLAGLAVKRGDAAAVRQYADQALGLQPGHPSALLALAQGEIGEPEIAEQRLRQVLATELSAYDHALALGLLADVLDVQDKPAQAFTAYERSNAMFREQWASRFDAPGQETVPQVTARLNAWADALRPGDWPAAADVAGQAGERTHVFLTGFPRSGTTLMESVLAAHPDVVSLEERNTFQASVLAFLDRPEDLAKLQSASEGRIQALRDDYWRQVRRFGAEPKGRIFIDKNPFGSLKLGLIKRLFPQAKIIFAVRDPRDVVLSCFRRRFHLNASTYELLDLERAAISYAGSMRFSETLRDKLGFDEHTLFYERLIGDFSGAAMAACAFIGASWREDLGDFASRAHRGQVGSASSAQIARGLYSEGTSHWRRYRAQLAPVLPILAPWVERFGYPAE